MKRNQQSDPNEKDIYRIGPLQLALIILGILRDQADEAGRAICQPNFVQFIDSALKERGYTDSGYRHRMDKYSQSATILYQNRLLRRVSGKNGHASAVFLVDMTTSYEQARELDRALKEFLCKDLLGVLDELTPESILEIRSDAIQLAKAESREILLAQQASTIASQSVEIERLGNLVKETLQEAEELAKKARIRLKQA